jgi:cadmium resistance protein CadD (predicted permease)
VGHLAGTVATAVAVFAGANIDGFLVLTMLFLSSRVSGRPEVWQVLVGQYIGMAALVTLSTLAAAGLRMVPGRWVGLLGLVPIGLGIRGLLVAVRANANREDTFQPIADGTATVTALTVANGGDNISVYTPFFRALSTADWMVTVAVFAILVAAWLAAAHRISANKRVLTLVSRVGRWLVPAAFITVGCVIVAASGVLDQLTGLPP